MSEPSWIGDDGLRYKTWCNECEEHHQGDCEEGSSYDEYDMWREMQNDLQDGIN